MDSVRSPISPLPLTPSTPNEGFNPSKRPRTHTTTHLSTHSLSNFGASSHTSMPFQPLPIQNYAPSTSILPQQSSQQQNQQQTIHHLSHNTLPSLHDALSAHSFTSSPWTSLDSTPLSPAALDMWPSRYELPMRTSLPPPVQIFDLIDSPAPSPFTKDADLPNTPASALAITPSRMVSLKDLSSTPSPLPQSRPTLSHSLTSLSKSSRPIELADLAKDVGKQQPENRGIKRASVPEPLRLSDIARSFPTSQVEASITPSSGNRTQTPQVMANTPSSATATTPLSLSALTVITPTKTPSSAQGSSSGFKNLPRAFSTQSTSGLLSLANLAPQPSNVQIPGRKATTQPPTPKSTPAMPSFRLADLLSTPSSISSKQEKEATQSLAMLSQAKVRPSLSSFPQHSSDPSMIVQKDVSTFTLRPDVNIDEAIERANQMSRSLAAPPFPLTRSRSAPSPSAITPSSAVLVLPSSSQADNKPLERRDLDRILDLSTTPTILEEAEPPQHITLTMHQYQTQGLAWLIAREKNSKKIEEQLIKKDHFISLDSLRQPATTSVHYPRGGILADEQGLGKTLQMISLILANPGLSAYDPLKPGLSPCKSTLVVCPLTMVHQWEAEIRNVTHQGALSVYIYHGGSRVKNHAHLANFDIVITTYNILVSDLANEMDNHGKSQSAAISKLNWYRIILDESHVIKDHTTRSARAACCLSADIRWCLTGTPVQNKIDDLYSLLKFLRVDPYGRYDYWNQYVMKPQRASGAIDFKQFQTILRPILLRRTKDQKIGQKDIVKMAPKIIQVRSLRFQEHEAQIYRSLWADSQNSFKKLVETNMVFKNYSVILDLLLRLRQACDHPSLCYNRSNQSHFLQSTAPANNIFDDNSSEKTPIDDMKSAQISEEKCVTCCDLIECGYLTSCGHIFCLECFDTVTDDICPYCEATFTGVKSVQSREKMSDQIPPVGNTVGTSTKIQALMKELHLTWLDDPTTKAIIFSQWTGMLDLIEAEMVRTNISFERLDGRMASSQRDSAIRNFKSNHTVKIILISLKAGGVGLNLAEASRVFVMDPWWNPATEEQAIDRAHRVNQTRPVVVTRFIIENTIEEKILQLQQLKSMMARGALGTRETDSHQLKIEQLRLLFSEPTDKPPSTSFNVHSPARF
eukprot:TRINITY_DN6717_c2_g1_i3.p1 TRINITY_DN6717_c2_g1~~TRINITY_DN6717_c2_g1_i3.p1  ORF type:complete len:1146 (-),score=194.54 TRINITY_DN6717_c2_g1_i3:238-3675(-)